MNRSVREDLIPSYTEKHGLHFIVDTNTSQIRKMLPKEVVIEETSLAELEQADAHTLMDYVQKRKFAKQFIVVFLALDSKRAERRLVEVPSRSTPATKLRDLIPPLLEEGADSITYIVKNTDMVLTIKHRWRPADVYLFDNPSKEEKKK